MYAPPMVVVTGAVTTGAYRVKSSLSQGVMSGTSRTPAGAIRCSHAKRGVLGRTEGATLGRTGGDTRTRTRQRLHNHLFHGLEVRHARPNFGPKLAPVLTTAWIKHSIPTTPVDDLV